MCYLCYMSINIKIRSEIEELFSKITFCISSNYLTSGPLVTNPHPKISTWFGTLSPYFRCLVLIHLLYLTDFYLPLLSYCSLFSYYWPYYCFSHYYFTSGLLHYFNLRVHSTVTHTHTVVCKLPPEPTHDLKVNVMVKPLSWVVYRR